MAGEPAQAATLTHRAVTDALRHVDAALLALAQGGDREDVGAVLEALAQARGRLVGVAADVAPADDVAVVPRVHLPPATASAGAARAFCRDQCEQWGLSPMVTSSVTDIASELVANAARLATGPITLALELTPRQLLVSVWDDAPGEPRLLPYRPGFSERGIGLRLVRQLSRDWGWTAEDGGKWVWAQVPIEAADDLVGAPRPRRVHGPGRPD